MPGAVDYIGCKEKPDCTAAALATVSTYSIVDDCVSCLCTILSVLSV